MSFYIKSRHASFSEAIKAAQATGRFDIYTQHVDGTWCVVRNPDLREPSEEEEERAHWALNNPNM